MDTIGNKLKAAREKQKMSLADVAQAVRIKTDFIAAIEKNEFYKLIAPVYARGFIKLYAKCVQLDPMPLLCQFDAAADRAEYPPVRQEPQIKKETFAAIQRRRISALVAALIDGLGKIKFPDISRIRVPAFKPVELPDKKWVALILAAVICIIILPIFARHISLPAAKIRVSPACRWIAEPPEPYLNIPAPKTSGNR